MICYISHNYTIYICILPRNGHYHACNFMLHFILPLNQNTNRFQILSKPFYLLLRPIDKINFFDNFYISFYLYSHMIVKDKTKLTHQFLSFVPILVIICFYASEDFSTCFSNVVSDFLMNKINFCWRRQAFASYQTMASSGLKKMFSQQFFYTQNMCGKIFSFINFNICVWMVLLPNM